MGQISTISALSNLKSVPPLAQPSHLCKAEMAQYLLYFYGASRRLVFSDSLRMPPPVVSFSATRLCLRRDSGREHTTAHTPQDYRQQPGSQAPLAVRHPITSVEWSKDLVKVSSHRLMV
jgi:hypothetical protein